MYVTPREACEKYNVSGQALRCWARDGKIKYYTTKGGHRRYCVNSSPITLNNTIESQSIVYARVSSRKQQEDLGRQIEFLTQHYPHHRVIKDTGSGLNFKRRGFKSILEGVFKGTIKEVVVAKKDRFSRFGFELFEWIFQEFGAQLLSIDTAENGESDDFQHELSDDLMAIITVFSARYYGKRNYKVLQKNQDLSN